ncbi:sugar porter family MFS transporter [Sphingomonas abietis]|uniref:Sugar porter family MFS transporter n=1 Tax=Sphingomonas abietis TaxID=3012344 RepID=A0ABY7NV37_9SPHN|nr:sugar porter family MFS transporter [Sphingomonas abietis]WBO23774.1 sugar porter family MFS transporter [Sphingomonas abietis]
MAASAPSDGAARTLGLAAVVAAVCGGLYGYDTGIVSGALLSMTAEFHLDHQMQEIVTAAILAGAVVGALGTSWLSEKFGRKVSVLIVAALFAVGAIGCSLAPTVGALVCGRLFLGLAVGGSTQVVPMYISELAPPEKRGRLVTMFNVAIGIGILLANIVGFGMHGVWSWRPMVAIAAAPALLIFVAMMFMPRSPRWAAENIGLTEAAGILTKLRTSRRQVRSELRQIRDVAQEANDAESGWSGIRQPWLRPALLAALGVAFFTQCGGLEMMIYYAPTFLSDVGFGSSSALLASLGVAIVYAVVTLLGCLYVDRIGRRRLMLIMIPGSVISLIGLGAMFATGAHGGLAGWATIAFLLAFMLFNSGGIQVCGWLLGSEMFPLAMRGPAASLHAAMLWGSNLIVTGTALSLVQAVGLGTTMWIYAGINLLSFLFVFRFVPETAGASLEDIEGALRAGKFSPRAGGIRNWKAQ